MFCTDPALGANDLGIAMRDLEQINMASNRLLLLRIASDYYASRGAVTELEAFFQTHQLRGRAWSLG